MHLRGTGPYAAVVVAAALTSACAAGSTSAAAPQPSQAPTSVVSATPPASAPPASATGGSASASTASLDYVAPVGHGSAVHKTVVGATYQRLAANLATLKPIAAGTAMCQVLTAETATITLTAAGHTKVFFVEGVPCRGVRLTVDGVAQPLLAGSMTLINQVRAIAGTSGLAHPMSPS